MVKVTLNSYSRPNSIERIKELYLIKLTIRGAIIFYLFC